MSACEYCNGECGGHCSDARYNRDIDEAYQRGRDEERADVVAYMAIRIVDVWREPTRVEKSPDIAAQVLDAIKKELEKGEHEVKR